MPPSGIGASRTATVQLWNTRSGKLLHTLPVVESVESIAFSANNTLLLLAVTDASGQAAPRRSGNATVFDLSSRANQSVRPANQTHQSRFTGQAGHGKRCLLAGRKDHRQHWAAAQTIKYEDLNANTYFEPV